MRSRSQGPDRQHVPVKFPGDPLTATQLTYQADLYELEQDGVTVHSEKRGAWITLQLAEFEAARAGFSEITFYLMGAVSRTTPAPLPPWGNWNEP